jgi:hypothetical protein
MAQQPLVCQGLLIMKASRSRVKNNSLNIILSFYCPPSDGPSVLFSLCKLMIADCYQVFSNSVNPTAVIADSCSYFVSCAICFFTRYQQYASNRHRAVPIVSSLIQSVDLLHFGEVSAVKV